VSDYSFRLPTGSPSQAGGYWLRAKSPYGDCKLEYLTDLEKLQKDYGFRNPNIHGRQSVQPHGFRSAQDNNLPGSGVWVRGSIVQVPICGRRWASK